MDNFYFLSRTQTEENSERRLNILKKMGLKAEISGFSILLGGHYYKDDNGLLYGTWWLSEQTHYEGQYIIRTVGDISETLHTMRYVGARPALSADLVLKKGINCGINDKGVLEYQYLDYPKTIENIFDSFRLEQIYKSGKLQPTGKKYVTDSADFHGEYDEYSSLISDATYSYGEVTDTTLEFAPREHIEYEYKGKKYIRFVADANCAGKILPDGRKCVLNKPYWVRVEPITWLIDKEANVALAKQIVFAGVPYFKYYEIKNKDSFLGYDTHKMTIFGFMKKNLYCFIDLSNEDTKSQINQPLPLNADTKNPIDESLPLKAPAKDQIDELDESLPLSVETKALLDRVNEVIKMLPPKEQELMLQRRNKLIEKYKTSIEKKDDFDIDKFSKPLRPRLALEEDLNPEVTLHAELYKLSCVLTKQESLVKRIKDMNTCLALFQEDISSLPETTITKEDMIRAIIFYSNKHHKYIGEKFKDKLEDVLTSYKEECERELEHFSSEETNQNELELTNYDENFELMSKIMDTLDKAVAYDKNIGVYADFIDKISSAIQGSLSQEEDEDSMASIIVEAKEAISRLDEAQKESLQNELQGIVDSRISKIKEMLSSSETLEATDLLTIERDLAEELHPFLIKLDNTANRFEALKSITEQVSNSRRILEERETVDSKPAGVIDSFATDIHNSLISLKLSESDEKAVKEKVGNYLDEFSRSLDEMNDNQVQAIRDFSYPRDEGHPLSVLQSSLAEISSLLTAHKHSQNDSTGQQASRRF